MLKRSFLLVGLVLLIDQLIKIYIKTHYYIGQETNVLGSFFRLHFIENNGMAFGMQFGGQTGKIILTLIRVIAVIIIGYILVNAVKRKEKKILIYSLSLILAGAMGNIIDSAFYGLIFSESDFLIVAQAFPEGGGYASFLQGKVVDMFYAPIVHSTWPSWVPIFGGKELLFFRPIFNFADASISVGVCMLLLFYKRIFPNTKPSIPAITPVETESTPVNSEN